MKEYTWIIREDYKSDKHIGEGEYEGDCVYVLGHDKKNKLIFCYTGHAHSYTKEITINGPTIIESKNSIYYDEILNEMVEIPDTYKKPESSIYKYQRVYISYLFKRNYGK
jgi:hypothetical protein